MANYGMDSIDTMSSVSTNDARNLLNKSENGKTSFNYWNADRDMAAYETDNVKNPDLKKYIESMREYIARDDYMKHVEKSVTAELRSGDFGKSSGYWSDGKRMPTINEQANDYKTKAQEALSKIDVNTLDPNDYIKLGDVTCNAHNMGSNLKEKAVSSSTIRATVGNLDPNQTATVINRLSPKAQQNFMKNAKALYPESIPDKTQMDRNAEESITKLLDEKPRPDFRNPLTIKDCVSAAANHVHIEHTKKEHASLTSSKHVPNSNRFDIDALAYGTLNKDGTGLDFN